MSTQTRVPGRTPIDGSGHGSYRHRVVIAMLAGLTALGAAGGASWLVAGGFGMPVEDLEPLGLTSWVLPGIWLFASVAVPCVTTTVLALRRWPTAPLAAVVAGVLLAVELLVQMPFVGLNPLQAVFGLVALALIGLGLDARRRGWR